jgi:hypothetical protein
MQDQVLVRAGDSGSHLESAVSGHESSGESCCRVSAIHVLGFRCFVYGMWCTVSCVFLSLSQP